MSSDSTPVSPTSQPQQSLAAALGASSIDERCVGATPLEALDTSAGHATLEVDAEAQQGSPTSFMVNAWDDRDLQRLGRRPQMKRPFRFVSMLSFTVIVQATWEFVLVSMYSGLYNGGRAGIIYTFICTALGFLPIVASLAELTSMSPTAGGQYHWVSEFASEEWQQRLSFFAGWQVTLAWQAGNAANLFATGTTIQALIWERDHDYRDPSWHATIIVMANAAIVTSVSIWGARLIPFMQNGLFAFHIILFLCVITPLWFLAPHASSKDVFATFYNGGGWSSMPLCLFVGQTTSIWACIGSDAAAHMAEEVRDASSSVARAMFWSYIINTCMGLLMIITVCFAIPDLDTALGPSLDHPFLYTFRQALPHPAPTVIASGILLLIFASNVSSLASTARETFAFARDGGLPLHRWLGVVDERLGIPRNALMFTGAISAAVTLINIGPADVFKLIISLNTSSIMLAYTFSISCILWRRLKHKETLPTARWSLGRLAVPTNVAGLLYAAWAFFWSLWPKDRYFRVSTFNWGIALLVGVSIYSFLDFQFRGKGRYAGPATLIERRRKSSTMSSLLLACVGTKET